MDKKNIIYALVIFIAIVIVGNVLSYKASDKKPNSMNFSNVDSSVYKRDTSKEGIIKVFLRDEIFKLINLKYDDFYNYLTGECKTRKFANSLDTFKEVISKKYFSTMSEFQITYVGYSEEDDVYIYEIEIFMPVYITDEERTWDVYKPKTFYIDVYTDSLGNYSIDFDS